MQLKKKTILKLKSSGWNICVLWLVHKPTIQINLFCASQIANYEFHPNIRIDNVSIPSKLTVTKTLSELDGNKTEVVVPHFIFATAGYHGIGSGSISGYSFLVLSFTQWTELRPWKSRPDFDLIQSKIFGLTAKRYRYLWKV